MLRRALLTVSICGSTACVPAARSPGTAALPTQLTSTRGNGAPGDAARAGGETQRALPLEHATTDDGLLFLTPPEDRAHALSVVERLFEAVVAESLDDLEQLLDDNAPLRTKDQTRSQAATHAWKQRFQGLDYTAFVPFQIYRPDGIEIYSAADLKGLEPARTLALTPGASELLVVVPIAEPGASAPGTTTAPGARYFGTKISLLLRRTESGFAIREMAEDFELR